MELLVSAATLAGEAAVVEKVLSHTAILSVWSISRSDLLGRTRVLHDTAAVVWVDDWGFGGCDSLLVFLRAAAWLELAAGLVESDLEGLARRFAWVLRLVEMRTDGH